MKNLIVKDEISNEKIKKLNLYNLWSQIATFYKNTGRGKHHKYLPYFFTEQGIAMLSGLLKKFRCEL